MDDSAFIAGALVLHGTLCYRPTILDQCLGRLAEPACGGGPARVRQQAEQMLRALGATPDWGLADRARRWLESGSPR